ncbi:MAG: iron ABC transporter permease [archaeon]|nr:iron ABC transporter permease [archaeon]
MNREESSATGWEAYSDRVAELESVYTRSTKRKTLFVIIVLILLMISVAVSLCVGAVDISLTDTLKVLGHAILPGLIDGPEKFWYSNIILNDRLSRVVLCILAGFSLAIAGSVMQNILRNPLVSPFTLGVSSAASFGAALGIIFGAGITGSVMILGHEFFVKNLLLVLLAFLAALGSIAFVIILSRRRDISKSTIILTGVIVSYLFQAGVSLCKYFSDDQALREITMWLLGGMWNACWGVDFLLIPIVLAGVIVLELFSTRINVLSAGDDVASNLGINVPKLRSTSLILCTLVTSVCIAFTGIIGFVGLIAPHVCRMFIGNDSRYLFPASGLLGALILLVSDTVARMIIRPEELPVGIIMYLLGGIFFIWLVSNRKKEVRF